MTWHPLSAAIETCLTRHHTGSNQPATPAPWMTAAADQIATAIIQHAALDQTRHIALDQTRHIAALIELGVDA